MANVSGAPLALASSAIGLIWAGALAPRSSRERVSVIACPFRFRYMGITIGFTGEPCRPIVEA